MKKIFTVLVVSILIFGFKSIKAQATTQIQALKQQICLGGNKDEEFELLKNVFELKDGSRVIFGYTKSINSSFGISTDTFRNLVALRVDAEGETIWSKNFGFKGFEQNKVIQCIDSTGFFIGTYLFPDSNATNPSFQGNIRAQGIIQKIDNDGNLVWMDSSFYHTTAYKLMGYSATYVRENFISLDDDGGVLFILSGNLNASDVLGLAYFNNTGNLNWLKTYTSAQLTGGNVVDRIEDYPLFIDDRFIFNTENTTRNYYFSISQTNGAVLGWTFISNLQTFGFTKLPNNTFMVFSEPRSNIDRPFIIGYNKNFNILYNVTINFSLFYGFMINPNTQSIVTTYGRNYGDHDTIVSINYTNGQILWKTPKNIIDSTLDFINYNYFSQVGYIDDKTILTKTSELDLGSNYKSTLTSIVSLDNNGHLLNKISIDTITINNKEFYAASDEFLRISVNHNTNTIQTAIFYTDIDHFVADSSELFLVYREYDAALNKVLDLQTIKLIYRGEQSYFWKTNLNQIIAFVYSYIPSDCNLGGTDLKELIFSPNYNTILGKTYIDSNNNNTYNAGTDFLFSQGFIKSTKGNINQISYLNDSGQYQNYVDTGSYNTIFIGYNNYYTVLPVSKTTTHATYGNVDTVDFALKPKGNIKDLRVSLVNTWVTRPGFTNSYEAVYVNEGTTVVSNASVAVVLDNRLTYNNAVPSPTAIAGDTLKWNLDSLNPSQQGKIVINFTGKIPPTLNGNDSLLSKAIIYPVAGDTTPTDNRYTLTDIARNAFDPNDKNIESNSTLTPTQITAGDYITYRVRFQNTGNFYATNVIIRDTLESNLDWSSLQVIAASHSGLQTSVQSNNVVEFRFDNINLPASSVNEAASHGYIVFKIKPKNTLVAGNTIKNTAHITFDFNTPIKTNIATAKVITITGTINKHNTIGELNLFPNPNNGNFTVDFSSKGNYPITVTLFDVTGKVVYLQTMQHNDRSLVQISDAVLASGLYNLQISGANEVWNKKVLITK